MNRRKRNDTTTMVMSVPYIGSCHIGGELTMALDAAEQRIGFVARRGLFWRWRLTSTRHCVIIARWEKCFSIRTPAKRAGGPKAISYQSLKKENEMSTRRNIPGFTAEWSLNANSERYPLRAPASRQSGEQVITPQLVHCSSYDDSGCRQCCDLYRQFCWWQCLDDPRPV
jgi:hypothetical protein